jgi:uncharacterized protein (TIRG00374 family)
MRTLPKIVVPVVLVGFLLGCVLHFSSSWEDFSLVAFAHPARAIALALVLSMINYLLRALRWMFYLRQLGCRMPLGFVTLTYFAGFAFSLSPGKVGELARAHYYVTRGTPFQDIAAVCVTERLMDLIAMLALAGFALYLFPSYQGAILVPLGLAIVATGIVIFMPWRSLARVEGDGKLTRVLTRCTRHVAGTLQSARALLRPASFSAGVCSGAAAWAAEGVGLYVLCSMSSTAQIGVAAAIGIYALASLAGAATLLPGGLVGTEVVMTGLLIASGVPAGEATLITLVCRIVTLWFAIALGWGAVLLLGIRLRGALSW